MIEIPEAYVLAAQVNEALAGKTIANVTANAHPHKFAWFSGNPEGYHNMLSGKKITEANPGTRYTCGGNTEVLCEDMLLVFSTPLKLHQQGDKLPKKHQLLIEFEDFTHLSATVQMWGAMLCYPLSDGPPEGYNIKNNPTPMDDAFDENYFSSLRKDVKGTLSVKAFLATEQRIPGLGNGVLQDILFNAKIHPKTKLEKISDSWFEKMYSSVKDTIRRMAAEGGRDTEKDLYGVSGGYKTILSNKTVNQPCPACGDKIMREAYLGGNIYFCPTCQKLEG